jgi:hypothetical protein
LPCEYHHIGGPTIANKPRNATRMMSGVDIHEKLE